MMCALRQPAYWRRRRNSGSHARINFPLNVNGTGASLRNSATGPIPAYEINYGRVNANATWQLDFWGLYRRATEAARAQLLANEWARQEVNATLVANVASAYFQLRELDLELDITKS